MNHDGSIYIYNNPLLRIYMTAVQVLDIYPSNIFQEPIIIGKLKSSLLQQENPLFCSKRKVIEFVNVISVVLD